MSTRKMKKLLDHIIKGITASNDYSIEESIVDESNEKPDRTRGKHVSLVVKAKPDIIGLIIGKGGKTVRALRNLLRVKATLEKSTVSLSIEEF